MTSSCTTPCATPCCPVVTIIGLNFGGLVSGAVLTETIFGLTGVGRTLVDGITARDYTLVQGFTIVIATAFVDQSGGRFALWLP